MTGMKSTVRIRDNSLKLTSTFEGGAHAVSGNFDGQVMSFGPLQWNLGQKTLQPLLKRIVELDENQARILLTPEIVEAIKNGTVESFVRQFVLDPKNPANLYPVWKNRFIRLAASPLAKEVFRQFAEPYFKKAESACELLGFVTERAFALCFDIAVQNGGVRRDHLREYRKRLTSQHNVEWEKLKLLAQVVSDLANPRWKRDVLSRKLSIALGGTFQSGMEVHGRRFDVKKDFDIHYEKGWKE